MTGLARSVLLLEALGRYQQMGSRLRRGSSTTDSSDLLTILAFVVGVVVAAWLVSRALKARERGQYNSPRRLFGQLCRAHRLDWAGRRMLCRLARWNGVAQPARLFLEPERFDAVLDTPALSAHHRQVAALREELFGTRSLKRRKTRTTKRRAQ